MFVSVFSYFWIPESPTIWERAADSVYICLTCLLMSHHFVTCFPWSIVGGIWDSRSLPSLIFKSVTLKNTLFLAESQ